MLFLYAHFQQKRVQIETLHAVEDVRFIQSHQMDISIISNLNSGTVLPIRSFHYDQGPQFPLQLLPRFMNLVELGLSLPFHVVPQLLKGLEASRLLESLGRNIRGCLLQGYSPVTELGPLYNITRLHLTLREPSEKLAKAFLDCSRGWHHFELSCIKMASEGYPTSDFRF
ncbi:hypothetical protein CPB86DRAFT_821058 [Serendipita vermifera]|nr:hypothetical protein CPB86DRAFT_821058 [Serendipita vermifera]